MIEHCITCRWYRPLTYDRLHGGVCLRCPPTVDDDSDMHGGRPKVDCGDYCGEFETRQEATT